VMAELIMTRGLPASGKSTWACTHLATGRPGAIVRVNKDLLRKMLHDGTHRGCTELQVLRARDALVGAFLADGVSVIVDDTNLNPVHETVLRDLAQRHGAIFSIKDFTEVSLEECVTRDLARAQSVGETAIITMYDRWLKPDPLTPSQPPVDLASVVLVDIDGTVALMDGRGPFDWAKVGSDKPNMPVHVMVKALAKDGYRIVFLSGRDSTCREQTISWLRDHFDFDFDLLMRPVGDNRKDAVVKRELFDTHIAGRYHVLVVLDDRDQVVRMWRDDLGLTCLQVAPGAF